MIRPLACRPITAACFAAEAAPLLAEVRLPDSTIAPIIYDLSHTETEGTRQFVNYRDMSVQQLGSIYERLLEREPVRDDDGKIVVRPNPYARKDSGSFFTPQELVDLIVDRTLKPLAEERLKAFEDKSKELKSDHRPTGRATYRAAQGRPRRGGSGFEGTGPREGKAATFWSPPSISCRTTSPTWSSTCPRSRSGSTASTYRHLWSV